MLRKVKESYFLRFTAFSILYSVDKNVLPVNVNKLQIHLSAEKHGLSVPLLGISS